MKHVLVPTDFSDCAQNATKVAVRLAQKFGAALHFYSCISLPSNWDQLTEEQRQKNAKATQLIAATEEKLTAIVDAYPNVAITTSYSGGKLVEQVQASIEKHKIDFVVMGSHGTSGISEFFIGSNTQKVVRTIHCPVLVVKGAVEDISFKQVVFASNFNLNEKDIFLKFKEIISPFNPVIHLLAIKSSFFFEPPISVTRSAMEQFREAAAPFECKLHIFKNTNIEGGIRSFSARIDADLIAVSNNNRNPFKRMIAGSNVEALINHANLPVLSLDFAK